MRSTTLGWLEIKRLLRRRIVRAALVAVALVPLLYGALYLAAFWDPYGRIDQMPVALVNLDKPATVDGTTLDVGRDLDVQLQQSRVFDWRSASAAQAAAGLEDGTYYLSLTIPADFSSRLASVTVKDPQPAALQVALNPASNYLASSIGQRVLAEVRAAAAESVSADYFDRIFVGLADSKTQIQRAAGGANRLAAGTGRAAEGGTELASGLETARGGSSALVAGLVRLSDGTIRLADGATLAADGAGTLAGRLRDAEAGAADLASGGDRLAAGAGRLEEGLRTLQAASRTMTSSSGDLRSGAAQVADGVREAVDEVSQASAAATQLSTGAGQVQQALQAFAAANPQLASDPTFQAALAGSQQVAGGLGQLSSSLATAGTQGATLVAGAGQTADGAAQLAAGLKEFTASMGDATGGAGQLAVGVTRLNDGTSTLADGLGRAADGAAALADGAVRVAGGATTLSGGAVKAGAGARALDAGLTQLSSGADRLSSGLAQLSEGAGRLSTGLISGASAIPAYDAATRADHAQTMSNPVRLTTNEIRSVPNYGTGLAPYFIALALWVGALLTYYLIRPLSGRALASALPDHAVALAGYWPAALVVIVQALVLITVVWGGLGLSAANIWALYGFAVVAGLSFAAIIQWLVGAFGSVGKFLGIAFLMLQVTSAAGTFPIETAPAFFRTIHPLLPMTHVVVGLRQAISGGDLAALGQATLAVAAFGLAGFALTIFTVHRRRQWTMERLHPALVI
jgi:putative membrane protein